VEYTVQQQNEFRQSFYKRRTRQWVVAGIVGVGFLLRGLGINSSRGSVFGLPEAAIFAVMVTTLIGGFAFTLWNWRCPACNCYLGRRINPKLCSGCGIMLHD